tara:strand:+ start:183 stop:938 length:756 start_codon:yes stop_codon:yes gene_type:complete
MKLKQIILFLFTFINLFACADYKIENKNNKIEKLYYSSSGFVLVYNENSYKEKIVNRKINNQYFEVIHNKLKKNTPIIISNPSNLKTIETKISKKGNYPNIYTMVISEKIATVLELDLENPLVNVDEIKKNKKFIAKEGNTFEEERNVASKAPVDEIEMSSLTTDKKKITKKLAKKNKFILLISDFYYFDTANSLKNDLIKKLNINNVSVKKINNNKYRLLVGPFKNFNALKTVYISLNELGFESLNIYKE